VNTFDLSLEPFNEREAPTGCRLSLRSATHGVEIVVRVHRPGPKGGTFAEQSLGCVHMADVVRVMAAVNALMGGQCP
jgi:hypothetical protein